MKRLFFNSDVGERNAPFLGEDVKNFEVTAQLARDKVVHLVVPKGARNAWKTPGAHKRTTRVLVRTPVALDLTLQLAWLPQIHELFFRRAIQNADTQQAPPYNVVSRFYFLPHWQPPSYPDHTPLDFYFVCHAI
jgi:hypothetical protein